MQQDLAILDAVAEAYVGPAPQMSTAMNYLQLQSQQMQQIQAQYAGGQGGKWSLGRRHGALGPRGCVVICPGGGADGTSDADGRSSNAGTGTDGNSAISKLQDAGHSLVAGLVADQAVVWLWGLNTVSTDDPDAQSVPDTGAPAMLLRPLCQVTLQVVVPDGIPMPVPTAFAAHVPATAVNDEGVVELSLGATLLVGYSDGRVLFWDMDAKGGAVQ